MKPDQQSNYWQHDPATDAPEAVPQEAVDSVPAVAPEMYTPETIAPVEPPSPETPAATPTTPPTPENPNDVPVHWSANEYIHHEKNGMWFAIFAVVVVVLIALDLLVLKSYTFTALVIVMAIAIIVYSRRPPRTIDYTLSILKTSYILSVCLKRLVLLKTANTIRLC
jgi:hypothetical protein